MKLSMWIIQDWLKSYDPLSTIVSGEACLEGVCFLVDRDSVTTRYLYVYETVGSDILLVNKQDAIRVTCNDVDEIFNCVMEAFAFYNEWERTIYDATFSHEPEQRLIDACKDIFGPIFLNDMKTNLIAYSGHYGLGDVNFIWDDFVTHKNSTLATLKAMQDSEYFRLMPHKHECTLYIEPAAAPYVNAAMVSYCDDDDELLGQLVFIDKEEIGEHTIQIAQTLKAALARIRYRSVKLNISIKPRGIVRDAFLSGSLSAHDKNMILMLNNWQESDRFRVVALKPNSNISDSVYENLVERVEECFYDCLAVAVAKGIICLIRILEGDKDRIEHAARQTQTFAGVSRDFTGIDDVMHYCKQAFDALDQAMRTKKKVVNFHECALFALTHSYDKKYHALSLHPAVLFLNDYDKEHSTKYSKTLYTFLRTERSYTATADQLYIHRNTVLYRLQKIQGVFPLDLDDSYEREYLMCSFWYAKG